MSKQPELRQNIINGEWILIAPSRHKRPHLFVLSSGGKPAPVKQCPFDNPQASGNGEPVVWFSKEGRKDTSVIQDDWLVQVILNKYPAFSPHKKTCPTSYFDGFYNSMAAEGSHEVVVTRSHTKFIHDMSVSEAELVICAYQYMFQRHMRLSCTRYVHIFHNHGQAAGASVWHPHSQIIALPFIPRDVNVSLKGARKYWREHSECVHCAIIKWEKRKKKRIVYENKKFIAFVPYASHVIFEMRIFPKDHNYRFDAISEDDKKYLADALTTCLKKLKVALKNPAYNFFIHASPVNDDSFEFYHWHVEILPKTSHHSGVELGIGVEVLTVTPEEAASILKKA